LNNLILVYYHIILILIQREKHYKIRTQIWVNILPQNCRFTDRRNLFLVEFIHITHQTNLNSSGLILHHNPPGKTSDTNLSLPTTSMPKPVKQFRLQNSHSRISKNGLQQLFRLMELKKDGNSGYKRHVDFSSDYKGHMMRI
jgi:hypothetical protein